MSTQPTDDRHGGRLPSSEELLSRGRPFPPYEEMTIDGLSDEQEAAFLQAIADA